MISYLREGFIPVFISTSKKSNSLILEICKGCGEKSGILSFYLGCFL